jgi:hypothetical protein
MSYQTLILFPSAKAAFEWRSLHQDELVMSEFERAWIFEEDQALQRYYQLAEGAADIYLISYAMDCRHAQEWLEHCRSSHLQARYIFFETGFSRLDYEWWARGWAELLAWKCITGKRLVMIGFNEEEKRKWTDFCEYEQGRLLWIDLATYRFSKDRYHHDDWIILAEDSAINRALALIFGQGPTFSRPLMLSSRPCCTGRAASKWRIWWSIFRFRSRWF